MPKAAISSNMEDYLEVINALVKDKGVARVGEIAAKMSVKSPSVNAAIKLLADRKLVTYEKYGVIELTAKGRALAEQVQGKHDALYCFLTKFLKVPAQVADEEACMIEHVISEETADRLVRFYKSLEWCRRLGKPLAMDEIDCCMKDGKPCARN